MTDNGRIPFVDLVTPHLELEEEFVGLFRKALVTGGFVGGPMLEDFEREFAEFCGVKYCVGVGSGTDALRFALIAAGVRAGDTVVTVPNTFIATTEAITQAGARPDFVEIDERTYNMDAKKLKEYLEKHCLRDRKTGKLLNQKTQKPVTAILPVHIYGQMADMDPIQEVAERYNLAVIEDACQAHGAEYFSGKHNGWRRAGSMGAAAAFSFYPAKNLGACGEAGALTTNDEALASTVRMLRDHGQTKKYYHEIEGYNGRLDAIQAGILRIKLRHLAEWNERRREIARRYNELFSSLGEAVLTPQEAPHCRAAYHLYVIRVQNRDQLQAHLTRKNISTLIHYPLPLHLQRAYDYLGYREGDFPLSEKVTSEILSLPLYPHLGVRQQELVVAAIEEFLRASAGPENATSFHREPMSPGSVARA